MPIKNERKSMEKIAKFFRIKGAGFILLAFAAGILLLLVPSEKTEAEKPSKNEYIESLEKNLKSVLESATGRKCVVMISSDGEFSYSYAANDKIITSYSENGITSKNVSREYVITTKNGDEALVVMREIPPKVKGVAVVCKNGTEEDANTIVSVVCTLFDLPDRAVSCVLG
jgi:stage III sporulation protein AG